MTVLPALAWLVEDAKNCLQWKTVVEQHYYGAFSVLWPAEIQHGVDI